MEENETNGEDLEVDSVIVNGKHTALLNGVTYLEQKENTLIAIQKNGFQDNITKKECIGKIAMKECISIKRSPQRSPHHNGNGVTESDNKACVNGFGKTLVNGAEHRFAADQTVVEQKLFRNGGCEDKCADSNFADSNFMLEKDMIGDTIDTLKQYTNEIDKKLECLEQCKTELSGKLSSHSKSKSENNDDKNENCTKNENDSRIENVSNGTSNGKSEEFLPMLSIEDEVFPSIPDATDDEDMLIQEKIMQSKSELVSKLSSHENVSNFIMNEQNEITTTQCVSTEDTPSTSEAGTSSSEDKSSVVNNEMNLFLCCRQGYYEKVKELLTSDTAVDVNMTDGDCWSCLHETSIRNCQFTRITELLLQNGANPNLRDKKGETPLHGAVLFHLLDTIKLLLQYNADFNICNNQNVSPLKLATYLKDNEILLLFGQPVSEEKTPKKKKKKRKRNSNKDFTLPMSTSPSILKKRRASDEPCSSTTNPRSKKRINFSL